MTDTMERQDIALADIPMARDLVPQDRRLLPCSLEDLNEGADILQAAGGFIDQKLRQDRGACVAVAYMAALHGTDLIGTGSQAYSVGGRLAFMSQYINALLQRHLTGNPEYTFEGAGATRQVRVVATPKGGKPLTYTSPQMGQIKVKNSPLWITDPDQQLCYYGIRAWARRHKPDVLLGIYAVEELQAITVRDITPAAPADLDGDADDPVDAVFEPSGGFTTTPDTPTDDDFPGDREPDLTGWAKTLAEDASMATDVETLHQLWDEADGKRRALHRQNRSAHDDLEKAFIDRQNELQA